MRLKPPIRFTRLFMYAVAIVTPGTIIIGLMSNILNDVITKTQLVSPQEIRNAIGQHLPIVIVGIIIWVLVASVAIYLRLQEQQSLGQRLSTTTTRIRANIVNMKDRDRRNQLTVLNQVRKFWVEGVLEQSLHGAAMIDLGLSYKPDAVVYPWQMVIPQSDGSIQVLPSGLKIIDVFDQHSGALLILGEPGAGKTTVLLDLARTLIARAEQDVKPPIPVIFNLSSWAQAQQPLSDWLRDELHKRYNVPAQVGAAWIMTDCVAPLLDGLDEVPEELREQCIETINIFRQEHGLAPLVVCSRSADYNISKMKLRLETAVVLQPLTPTQIDIALVHAGRKLAAVRTAVKKHSADGDALRTLLESPLMLSVVLLAYQGVPISSLPSIKTVDVWRDHVFTAYVQRMLSRPRGNAHYTSTETNRWLTWLAAKMQGHSQTIFYLEDLDLTWLTTDKQRQNWKFTIVIFITLVGGLVGGLVGPLVYVLNYVLPYLLPYVLGNRMLPYVLGGGLGGGLVALASGVFKGAQGKPDSVENRLIPNQGIWRSARNGLVVGLVVGLAVGLVVGLGLLLDVGLGFLLDVGLALPTVGLVFGLVVGLAFALASGAFKGAQSKPSNVKNCLIPNQGIWGSARNGLAVGLVVGLGLWLGLGLGLWLGVGLPDLLIFPAAGLIGLGNGLAVALAFGLAFGLAFVLAFVLASGAFKGAQSKPSNVKNRLTPNQGIWRSARNGLAFGLAITLTGGLTAVLILMFTLSLGVGAALILGLIFGLSLGLAVGLHSQDNMEPVERFSWSWGAALEGLRLNIVPGMTFGLPFGLPFGLSGGLVVWLGFGLGGGLIGGLVLGLIGGLVVGLVVTLAFALGSGVFKGLQSKPDSVENRLIPNQGIWRSAHNGLVVGLAFGLGGGLIFGLGGGLIFGPIFEVLFRPLVVLIAGLTAGLGGGLNYGGVIWVRHTALRLVLWRKGYTSFNYVRFLDEAADRILLRRVGGGYIFVHRMLLDYFVSRYKI